MSKFVSTLDYDCKTIGPERQTSVALPMTLGTPFSWRVTRSFGLNVTKVGMLDPGGPPGHVVYVVFNCEVEQCYYVGFANFSLDREGHDGHQGHDMPAAVAHVKVLALSHGVGDPDITV